MFSTHLLHRAGTGAPQRYVTYWLLLLVGTLIGLFVSQAPAQKAGEGGLTKLSITPSSANIKAGQSVDFRATISQFKGGRWYNVTGDFTIHWLVIDRGTGKLVDRDEGPTFRFKQPRGNFYVQTQLEPKYHAKDPETWRKLKTLTQNVAVTVQGAAPPKSSTSTKSGLAGWWLARITYDPKTRKEFSRWREFEAKTYDAKVLPRNGERQNIVIYFPDGFGKTRWPIHLPGVWSFTTLTVPNWYIVNPNGKMRGEARLKLSGGRIKGTWKADWNGYTGTWTLTRAPHPPQGAS